MHCLHVTPYYAPAYAFGGVVRAVEGLSCALVKRGHDVTVLTTDALSLDEKIADSAHTVLDGVRVLRVPNVIYGLRKLNLSTPFSLAKTIETILPEIDIVHLHEFRTVENLLLQPLLHKYDIPAVLSPHGTLNLSTGRSSLKVGWDKLLSPRIARQIQHVIALAEPELDDIREVWANFNNPKTSFSIIPNGVNPDDLANLPSDKIFREQYNLGDSQIVLFMGRLHQRKGVEVLAQAFLQANIPNTKLVFAGPDEGMQPTLEALADERIILTGYLGGAMRLAALSSARLFALPAMGEGFSMAVLEAMSAGLPVLLSPGCNFPEAESANAGRIVEPEIESLTEALRHLLSDENALVHMGKNARNLIHERFTWAVVTEQIESIYQKLL